MGSDARTIFLGGGDQPLAPPISNLCLVEKRYTLEKLKTLADLPVIMEASDIDRSFLIPVMNLTMEAFYPYRIFPSRRRRPEASNVGLVLLLSAQIFICIVDVTK